MRVLKNTSKLLWSPSWQTVSKPNCLFGTTLGLGLRLFFGGGLGTTGRITTHLTITTLRSFPPDSLLSS